METGEKRLFLNKHLMELYLNVQVRKFLHFVDLGQATNLICSARKYIEPLIFHEDRT